MCSYFPSLKYIKGLNIIGGGVILVHPLGVIGLIYVMWCGCPVVIWPSCFEQYGSPGHHRYPGHCIEGYISQCTFCVTWVSLKSQLERKFMIHWEFFASKPYAPWIAPPLILFHRFLVIMFISDKMCTTPNLYVIVYKKYLNILTDF